MDKEIKDLMLQLQEPFNPNDISWRIQQAGLTSGKPWMIVLPYITSRAIQQRLDEVFGTFGWEVEHREIFAPRPAVNLNLTSADTGKNKELRYLMDSLSKNIDSDGFLTTIRIFDQENNRWIAKQDVSQLTDIESLKGGASGGLKRAGALLGIGRYLYHLESDFATCTLCDKKAVAFNNFSKPKDKKTGQYFGVDWIAPKLPEWALPGLECSKFSDAILQSKDLKELNATHANAYRWASSFGQLDKAKQFEEERDNTAKRLADESKDSIAERYSSVDEWLNDQILNLDMVPDNGSVQTVGTRIGQQLTDKCAGQFFDSQEFFARLKAAVKAAVKDHTSPTKDQ